MAAVVAGQAVIEKRQLLKTLRWYDGFVIALCNPGFLMASLGSPRPRSVSSAPSPCGVCPSSSACCRPGSTRSRRRCSRAGRAGSRCTPTRVGAGTTLSRARSPPSATGSAGRSCSRSSATSSARWSGRSGSRAELGRGLRRRRPPRPVQLHRHRLHRRRVAVQHLRRAAVRWVTYVTGALLMIPLVRVHDRPVSRGDWHSSNVHWALARNQWGGFKIALVWLFIMGWSADGVEVCATFTPEYRHRRDSTIALRTAAPSRSGLHPPAARPGRLQRHPRRRPGSGHSTYVTAFNTIVGRGVRCPARSS